jgi:addiction module RelB/DinJ family antitoxin
MAQTSINIRTDEKLKKQFDLVCNELGINLSTAINIFMKTVVRQNRIPFPLSIDAIRKPIVYGNLSKDDIDILMQKSFDNINSDNVRPIDDVFDDFGKKYGI